MKFIDRICSRIVLSLILGIGGSSFVSCDRASDQPKSTSFGVEHADEGPTRLDDSAGSVIPTDASPDQTNRALAIEVVPEGFQQGDGPLRVALYDAAETFNRIDLAKWKSVYESDGKAILIELSAAELSGDKVAIAIFQDSNSNEKLDKNAFGIPKELYGFSNNPKRGFGPPKYAEVAIPISSEKMSLKITLH